jgi:hypothetical protein
MEEQQAEFFFIAARFRLIKVPDVWITATVGFFRYRQVLRHIQVPFKTSILYSTEDRTATTTLLRILGESKHYSSGKNQIA